MWRLDLVLRTSNSPQEHHSASRRSSGVSCNQPSAHHASEHEISLNKAQYSLHLCDKTAHMWTGTRVPPRALSYCILQTPPAVIGCWGGTNIQCYWPTCCVHLPPLNANNRSCRWRTRGASGRPCEEEDAHGRRRVCHRSACASFSYVSFTSFPEDIYFMDKRKHHALNQAFSISLTRSQTIEMRSQMHVLPPD